jgi:HEAT repeat protein
MDLRGRVGRTSWVQRLGRSAGRSRSLPACLLAIAGLAGGCVNSELVADPVARERLERRALDLLLRAAASELDVVRCNAIEALVQVAPREALPEFRESLRSGSPLVRFAACVALGQVRDEGSRAAISAALRDPDARVRLAAAFAAVRLGETARAADLLRVLNDHPDENLRSDAAYLIGLVGEPRALRRLRLAESREKSTRVRLHMYTAMARLGDESALDELIRSSQFAADTRLIALQSLAELKNEQARDALLLRCGPLEDYLEVRLIAARGLGYLGSAAGFDLAREHLFAQYYDRVDQNRTFRTRSLAALALGAIRDPRALPLLERLAATETDERTQVAACFAICQITSGARGS